MAFDEFEKQLEQPIFFDNKDVNTKTAYEAPKEQKTNDYYAKVVDFTNRIRKNHGETIKSVLIFGSAATGKAKKTSDIDVWVVFDDTSVKSTEDAMKIRTQIQLTASQMKDIHTQVNGLTQFWQWMRTGSPELFNYMRVGLVVYDSGFIKPVQRMLAMGLFPPSDETIQLKVKSCKTITNRVEANLKLSIFDLRYAATDICQAVVMHFYKKMPDQKKMPEYLQKLVDEKKLEAEYIEKFSQLNKLWKDIDHKIVPVPTADHLNKAMGLAEDIIKRMKKLLPKDLVDVEVPRLFR